MTISIGVDCKFSGEKKKKEANLNGLQFENFECELADECVTLAASSALSITPQTSARLIRLEVVRGRGSVW
jgi:hypothetical protein